MNTPTTPKKAFASQADLEEKQVSFTKLSDHAYAYTAEGDPNTGIVIGDDAVMVIDTQATPAMAQDVIRRIREVTDKPIRYVVLSHYHAVRVLGASAYGPVTFRYNFSMARYGDVQVEELLHLPAVGLVLHPQLAFLAE
jgi:glyoxylase-like metal-dependent hydrolase (beta-lactamase superfamily II)